MNLFSPRQFQTTARDDAWIPSSCALCYGTCSILAHRVDGVVVKIEGNPGQRGRQGPAVRQGRQRDHVPLRSQPADQAAAPHQSEKRPATRIRAGRRSAGTRRSTKSPTCCASCAPRIRASWSCSAPPRSPPAAFRSRPSRAAFGTPNYLDRGRRPALRQRRAPDQRHHARLLVGGAGFRVLQLRHLFRRLQGATARATPPAPTCARRRRARARHEDGGGRSDVQFRLPPRRPNGCRCASAPTRRWRWRCATCMVNELGDLRRPLPAGARPTRPT